METILEISSAKVRFGGLVAFSDVSLSLNAGSRAAIIGPNGAGKTTLLNAITGLVKLASGQILYDGDDLRRVPVHRRVGLGIGRTFQHSRLFGNRSLIEQVMCGAYSTSRGGLAGAILRSPKFVQSERELHRRAKRLIDRFGMSEFAQRPANELPGGHRRLTDVARALVSQPRLLLLDEVGAGLTDAEKDMVIQVVTEEVEERGMSLLFIEHDLDFVKALGETCFVIHGGRVIGTGTPHEVLARPDVLAAYVGVDDTEVADR